MLSRIDPPRADVTLDIADFARGNELIVSVDLASILSLQDFLFLS